MEIKKDKISQLSALRIKEHHLELELFEKEAKLESEKAKRLEYERQFCFLRSNELKAKRKKCKEAYDDLLIDIEKKEKIKIKDRAIDFEELVVSDLP